MRVVVREGMIGAVPQVEMVERVPIELDDSIGHAGRDDLDGRVVHHHPCRVGNGIVVYVRYERQQRPHEAQVANGRLVGHQQIVPVVDNPEVVAVGLHQRRRCIDLIIEHGEVLVQDNPPPASTVSL